MEAEGSHRAIGSGAGMGRCGGWAIDLFLGHCTRHHHDIEIAVAAHRFPEVAAALSEIECDVVGDGWSWPYPAALDRFRQTWLRDPVSGLFLLDVFREQHAEVTWTYRRDPTIALPYAEACMKTSDGVPHLIPELVPLLKAHTVLSKDQADFDAVLPALSAARRHRLGDWLTRTHPSHPWLEAL